jgi:hypothetical protein
MKSRFFLYIAWLLICCNTSGQNTTANKAELIQEGVLIYYMNEPYFFPIKDTTLETLSRTKVTGVKLGKVEFNDIFQEISHKTDIVIYAGGKNNKIDTVKSQIGILCIKIQTNAVDTKFSIDTAAFNFEYGQNLWALFRYTLGFDIELKAIEPILVQDIKSYKKLLKELESDPKNL